MCFANLIFFNYQEKVRNMYQSIGYPIPEYEGHDSEGRGSDEPIDVDTVDTEENHVPQATKKTKPRFALSFFIALVICVYLRHLKFCASETLLNAGVDF